MNNKQIRELFLELSPKPGHILKLSRNQFEEIVEDILDMDISEQPESNANRLKTLLKSSTDEQCNQLITAIKEY
jgi:hypothetical protein